MNIKENVYKVLKMMYKQKVITIFLLTYIRGLKCQNEIEKNVEKNARKSVS